MRVGLVVALAATWLLSVNAAAQTDATNAQRLTASDQASGATRDQEQLEQKLPVLVRHGWRKVVAALDAGDLNSANAEVYALDKLRLESGLEALEQYSSHLLNRAHRAIEHGDRDTTGFLTRKALQLSPVVPAVLLRAIPLAKYTGDGDSWASLGYAALRYSWSNPQLLIHFVASSAYPVLWAATIGLYVVLALLISISMRNLLKGCAGFYSPTMRGIAAPLTLLALLVVPCFFGPLWTLATWAILLALFAPLRRWLVFAVGVVLVLWSNLIPIRETLRVWLADADVQTMLNVSVGIYNDGDKRVLEAIAAKHPEDGAVYFTYGQLLRRLGEYESADAAFLRAEMLLGRQPWTRAQRGTIAFLNHNPSVADELYAQAEAAGLKSAEFLFNYSKIKFALSDTAASTSMLRRAEQRDRNVTASLREREKLLGKDADKAVGEIRLPLTVVLRSALSPRPGLRAKSDRIMATMMFGMQPLWVTAIGAVLMLVALGRAPTRRSVKFVGGFNQYQHAGMLIALLRMLPGGSWVLAGRLGRATLLISILGLLVMPLLGWPGNDVFILEYGQTLFWPYCAAAAGFIVLTVINGMSLSAEE